MTDFTFMVKVSRCHGYWLLEFYMHYIYTISFVQDTSYMFVTGPKVVEVGSSGELYIVV